MIRRYLSARERWRLFENSQFFLGEPSMSNQLSRVFSRALVPALFVLVCFSAGLAQTPSPTPVNPATQPPGQQVPPATAPPGTQQPSPQTPPGTNVVPAAQPTPIEPATQEPREPKFPDAQAQPLPP